MAWLKALGTGWWRWKGEGAEMLSWRRGTSVRAGSQWARRFGAGQGRPLCAHSELWGGGGCHDGQVSGSGAEQTELQEQQLLGRGEAIIRVSCYSGCAERRGRGVRCCKLFPTGGLAATRPSGWRLGSRKDFAQRRAWRGRWKPEEFVRCKSRLGPPPSPEGREGAGAFAAWAAAGPPYGCLVH
jgi:hypothetical protein